MDAPRNVLARAILDGGPFAMRKAEELAEVVLDRGRFRSSRAERIHQEAQFCTAV